MISPKIENSALYKEVELLAGLPDNDTYYKRKTDENKKTEWPDGVWCKWYVCVFSHHQDRWVSFGLTAISVYCLFIGVAHNVGSLKFLFCLSGEDWIDIYLWILLFGVTLPMLGVLSGIRVVGWGQKFAIERVGNLEKIIQAEVPHAALKE